MTDASPNGTSTAFSRRTLGKGAAWAAPSVATALVAPAYAASKLGIDMGLYVSASSTNASGGTGTTGFFSGNGPGTMANADTPQESFRNGTTWAESDMNWSDTTGATQTLWDANVTNGEGSFTPGGNHQYAGNYMSGTGFWFSRPTSSAGTGTGYSGTTTLASGAYLTNTVTAIYAASTAPAPASKITTNVVSKTLSPGGADITETYTGGVSAGTSFVNPVTVTGSSVYHAPTLTTLPDGRLKVTFTYVFTSNKAVTTGGTAPSDVYAQIISPHAFGVSRVGLLGYAITTDITGSLSTSTGSSLALNHALSTTSFLSTTGKWPIA